MKRPEDTATVAKINDPTPKATSPRAGRSSAERRTVAPTPTAAAKEAEGKRGAREQSDEESDPESRAGAVAEQVARSLDEAAQSIRNAEPGALADDLAAFARRQPVVCFGAAALFCFAAGHFLNSSGRDGRDRSDRS